MTADNIAFQVITPISMILVLLPLPWHWSARNVGTLLYIAWTFLGSLVYLVDSIVWNGNLNNPIPVWCDITSKFAVGLNVAVPAVSLCINRRLYKIATMKQVSLSPSQKRREVLIDLSIGLGFPILTMALHYIVQGHRFDIIENMGCNPTTYIVPLAVPLYLMWPCVLGFISMCYSTLSIRVFLKQRRHFNTMINRDSQLTLSRYTRLMALAGTDILLDLPLSIFILWSNVRTGFEPWVSWDDTHYNFSYVGLIPSSYFKANPSAWAAVQITRWSSPILCIIFFLFFGLAGESLIFQRRMVDIVLVSLRLTKPKDPGSLIASTTTASPSRRLTTQPSMVHIHVDKTCDADLEAGIVPESKPNDFITLQSAESTTINFPNRSNTTSDDASDASIELGAVHISRLSSPLDASAEPTKTSL